MKLHLNQAPMYAMSDVVTVVQKKKTDWKLNKKFSVGHDRPVKAATSTSRCGLLFPEKFLQDRIVFCMPPPKSEGILHNRKHKISAYSTDTFFAASAVQCGNALEQKLQEGPRPRDFLEFFRFRMRIAIS